jgi:4-oxalocrotonate tautomerase
VPIVRVEMWSGRSRECKESLAKAITEVVVDHLGCPKHAVTVRIDESPRENWVIGGQPCGEPPVKD